MDSSWKDWPSGSRIFARGKGIGLKYQAFISYSHAADDDLAPALQQALHRFAKPWYRMRALRVFRDKTGLSASPELWPSIEAALGESEHLILLAPPQAAGSEWVEKEIDWWLEHRSPSTLLIAVTEGDIAWDEQGDGFDPTQSSAVPVVLLDAFPAEPKWVDLRWANENARLSTDDPAFADAVADLAAPLHGRSKDEMIGEDVRQWRRTRRAVTGAVAVLALLAIAATAAAVFAFDRQREAEQQRNEAVVARQAEAEQRAQAETQASVARSRQLAAEAQALVDEELDLALLLAVESFEERPTSEARAVLLNTTGATPSLVRFLPGPEHPVGAMASESGSGSVLSVDWEGEVLVSDLRRGTSERHEVPGLDADRQPTPRPSGDGVGFIDSDGALQLWTVGAEQAEAVGWAPTLSSDATLGFSPSGRFIAAVGGADPWPTHVLDTETQSVSSLPGPGHGPQAVLAGSELEGPVSGTFSPDGRWLAANDELSGLDVRDLTTGELFEFGAATSFAFSPDSTAIVVGSLNSLVYSLALPSLEMTVIREEVLRDSPLGLQPVAFRPDGAAFLLGAPDGTVRSWTWPLDSSEPELLGRAGDPVTSLAFADDSTLLIADQAGSIEQWDLDRSATSGQAIPDDVTRVGVAAVSGNGELIAVGGCAAPAPEPTPNFVAACDGAVWIESTRDDPGALLLTGGGEVDAAAFTRDGRVLVSGGESGLVATDLATGAGERISDRFVVDLAINPVSEEVVTSELDGSLVMTSLTTGSSDRLRAPQDDDAFIPQGGITFSPDGQVLYAAGAQGRVSQWELDDGTETTLVDVELDGSSNIVDLAVSPDGGTLAVATMSAFGEDHAIRRYDIESSAELLPAIVDRRFLGGLAFSPDGASLAYSSSRGLVLWDLNRNRPIGPPFAPGAPARTAMVVGGPSEAPIAVQADAVSATWWRLDDSHLIEVACARANRTIEDSEWSRFAASPDEPSVACT